MEARVSKKSNAKASKRKMLDFAFAYKMNRYLRSKKYNKKFFTRK